jgi:hypothetical protein
LPTLPTTGGRPLDPDTRGFMEGRFSKRLDDVRIHADGVADLAARAVGARAFTIGRHISFAAGEYAPHTGQGQHLLAHELAHAVQNEHVGTPNGVALSSIEISDPSDFAEVAAERAADQVMAGSTPVAIASQLATTSTLATKLYRATAVCGPNPQRSASQRNLEHQLIQADYVANVNPLGSIEFAIPAASKEGLIGFCDLVDVPNKELFEVKSGSIWSIPTGLTEIDGYVYFANQHCGKGWKGGKGYPSLWMIRGTTKNGQVLVTALYAPGLVIYQWMDLLDPIAIAAAAAVAAAALNAAANAAAAAAKKLKKISHAEFDPVFRPIWPQLATRVLELAGNVAIGSRFLVVSASSAFINMIGARRFSDLQRLVAMNPQTLGTMNFGMTIMAASAGAVAAYLGSGILLLSAPGAIAALDAALAAFIAAVATPPAEAGLAQAARVLLPSLGAAAVMLLAAPRTASADPSGADLDTTLVKLVPTTKSLVQPGSEVEINGVTHYVIGIADAT